MKILLGLLLSATLVSCGAESNSTLSSQQPSVKTNRILPAGHYIISFEQLSTCVSGAQSLTEFNVNQGFIKGKRFSVEGPIVSRGMMQTAVCRVGVNTATANVEIATTTSITGPKGWSISSIEKVESIQMPKTLKPFASATLQAGTYIFENQRYENCTAGDYNFSYELDYEVMAGSFLLKTLSLKNTSPVGSDINRPAVCIRGNGYSSGVVTFGNPITVNGVGGVRFFYKKVIKTSKISI